MKKSSSLVFLDLWLRLEEIAGNTASFFYQKCLGLLAQRVALVNPFFAIFFRRSLAVRVANASFA
jgi:hypothetical protein